MRTSLLHNSLPLPRDAVAELLSLHPGRQVTATDRPINRTVSPAAVSGVDCAIASEPRIRARGIGTVAAHAVVVGGLVAQASSWVRLEWADSRERKEWAYYARKRGVVEVVGGVTAEQVLAGYRRPSRQADTLDLGAVCQRLLTQVQGRPQLDHRTGLRTRPTSLRWTAVPDDAAPPSVHLHIDDDVQRTLQLVVPTDLLAEAARFAEDLALHDWLYTALGNVVGQAERDMAIGADPMPVLNAALSLLVRLWMPGAHVALALRPLWRELETRPGFTESWDRQVAWIRDQISLRTLSALQEARH
ncbi:SCO2521 family protein [Actinokineospora sp. NPDC004072]